MPKLAYPSYCSAECQPPCAGTCTDILYSSMSVVLTGNMGHPGVTLSFPYRFIDVFTENFVDWVDTGGVGATYFGCGTPDYLTTSVFVSGYGTINYGIYVTGRQFTTGKDVATRIRASVRIDGPGSGGGPWKWAKEFFISDCSQLLTPLSLDRVFGPDSPPAPRYISAMTWNVNL